MGHAILGEGGGQFLAEVVFAVDVEQGADVGYLVGKEGEGVFLLLVNGIIRVSLLTLPVGGIIDAQRAGLATAFHHPGHRQRSAVAVGRGGIV